MCWKKTGAQNSHLPSVPPNDPRDRRRAKRCDDPTKALKQPRHSPSNRAKLGGRCRRPCCFLPKGDQRDEHVSRVGQREERYTHLLAGEPDLSVINIKPSKAAPSRSQTQKIAELEARIERLEHALDMQWDSQPPPLNDV